MLALAVRFDLPDQQAADAFDALVAEALPGIRTEEPGTLVYTTHTVREEPLARVFYELYADEAAFRAHEEAPHVVAFHERKDVLLAREPRVEFCTPGPLTGLASRPPGGLPAR